MATKAELQAEIFRLQERLRIAQNGLASLNRNLQSNQAILARYSNEVATIPAQIAALETQLAALQTPTGSAAASVANSANGATQNPATPPTSTGRLTTDQATILRNNTETGTNAPVKILTETQSVPPANTGNAEGRPGGQPGVGATGDDGTTAANTRQIISAATARQTVFQPRNNVLDQYASYTYNIGWYLMTPAQYTAQQKQQKIAISQYNLLVQSGGAPAGTAGVQPELTTTGTVAGTTQTAGRNPFFGLDYYFDNLEIKSTVSGKGTTRGHNVVSLSFTVTEPAAITLIDNLYSAVNSVYKTIETETVNNVQLVVAYYALVIRFYGYDQNGKIVQASDSDNKNAVVEKIIPFKLTNISFTVANKLVEYLVEGVAVPYDAGFGSNLGVIKSQIEITGATVKDLLTKGAAAAEVSPTDGRTSTPAPAKVGDLPVKEQAAIAAGTDSNLVNDDGMAFGGGGL